MFEIIIQTFFVYIYIYDVHTGASRWSRVVGGVSLDRKMHNYSYGDAFFNPITLTSLDVMYCCFTNACKTGTLIKVETLPLVWASCQS